MTKTQLRRMPLALLLTTPTWIAIGLLIATLVMMSPTRELGIGDGWQVVDTVVTLVLSGIVLQLLIMWVYFKRTPE